jgi:hypothetical protein
MSASESASALSCDEGCARDSPQIKSLAQLRRARAGPTCYRGAPRAAGSQRRTHRGITVCAGSQAVQDAIGSTHDLADLTGLT